MGHERTPRISGHKIASPGRGNGRLLSLEGAWLKCTVKRWPRGLAVEEEGLVKSGMSGSPILSTNWKAIAPMSMDGFFPVLTYARREGLKPPHGVGPSWPWPCECSGGRGHHRSAGVTVPPKRRTNEEP